MSVVDAPPVAQEDRLIGDLVALLGAENVLTTPDDIDFYSSDIFDQRKLAGAVLRPRSIEQIAEAVRLCTEANWAVVPRGGGMSYTGGYLPIREHTAVFDLAVMDKIVEINAEDMYVTVECGVTWRQLWEALQPLGLRTPYWGTVSGYYATVGGGLSQGSSHFGSAQYGISADSCLGLEVVLADGTIVTTGSGSSKFRPSPFFRNYGPDLTGLFLGDTGSLGFKVRATLRLIPAPPHQRYTSVAFETLEQLMTAMAEVSRAGLASECGGWSPALVQKFAASNGDLRNDLKYLAAVAKSGTSVVEGLKAAAKIALAGRRDWKAPAFLMHVTIDEFSAAAGDEKLKAVEAIAERHSGRAIPPSYPRAHRSLPFGDMKGGGFVAARERTVPSHGLCPHSRAIEVAQAVYAFFDTQIAAMAEHNITWSLIMSELYNNTTLVEPLIYWADDRGPNYARAWGGDTPTRVGPGDLAQIEAVRVIRRGLMKMFMSHGCAHLQVGKTYPYREGREPATFTLLEGIKRVVDPKGLMNPGSLGLA